MRPRSFDRGNRLTAALSGASSTSFNEAAIFRSRKRAWSSRSRSISRRFNEAAILRSRKQSTCRRRSILCGCFNEAAIFRSRKLEADDQIELRCLASMRPRSFDRGNRDGLGYF